MQPTYMRSVAFRVKFTSGSRICASLSDLLKVSNDKESTAKIVIFTTEFLLKRYSDSVATVELSMSRSHVKIATKRDSGVHY